MSSKIARALQKKKGRAWKLREIKARMMRTRVRAHMRDVRMFKTLGFRYDSAHGGRFIVDEKEFFEVAER